MNTFRKAHSEKSREHMIELLNQHVTDLTDLFIQTKLAHWNVRGSNFIAYHEFFDELAGHLPELIDSLAEQAGSLGGTAGKPVQFIPSETRLPAWELHNTKDIAVLEALTESWATAANNIREAVDISADEDPNTSDLFTEVSRALDKDLWFLESHLTDGISN
ncbi:DNA starvation/stationary phase protection protein Dps [Gracilibacillus alcaliphilus]|uniref:DNA starvation/stationary phase protection protein Dps n=1 Tax=Gracilibacillus alcaliphilus TaxID=1401441 RepID=UPI001957D61C|nr:DNA starvation/stationary phase protection protein Dps [Gracilibacillus alcaliphilus]MBM7676782.1 starvation-inducible DNA-binding protein [Gracilibacillus alcaliphilus]